MRAFEFLTENASSGATSSGNVATVVMPQQKKKELTFFGAPMEEFPEYGTVEPVVIRRNNPSTENKKD